MQLARSFGIVAASESATVLEYGGRFPLVQFMQSSMQRLVGFWAANLCKVACRLLWRRFVEATDVRVTCPTAPTCRAAVPQKKQKR